MSVGAVVLCGGQSRRMGRPKAWLPFGPERMLERVVRLAGSVARPIVVVAAPNQDLPPLSLNVTVVRDAISGRGPLQGLAAGLRALAGSVNLAFATGTDVPFLEPAWILRLAELIENHDLVIPHIDGYYHSLAALYRTATVLPVIDSLLREDRLRTAWLVESVNARVVGSAEMSAVDPELRTLRNLNTPEDYTRALNDAGLTGDDESGDGMT